MKKIVNLAFLLLIITILISSSVCSTYAVVTQKDLDDIRDEMEKTDEQLEQVQENLTEARKNIIELEGEISEAQYNLDTLQSELSSLQKEVDKLTVELEQKTKEYDEKHEIACQRVVVQYKHTKTTFLDVLLHSTSLPNFLSKYHTLNEVLNLDQQFLDELEEERQQIENDKATLEENKAKIEEKKKQAEKQKLALTNKKNDKDKLVSSLTAEEANLEKERAEYARRYEQMQEEFRRIAQQNGNTGGNYSGGKLQWPCPNYTRISSYFGGRGSPLVGGSSYHKGIDMAAPKGSSIVAAESGTVIAVYTGCTHNYGKERSCGCGGGFGNYLMVSHGGGLVTVYGHCTSINVSNGSKVTRGSTIATVGSTGASTGYHLHFGVLLNGTYVNPAPYIGL